MGSFDLRRENNMARNRALTVELGLMNASAFFGMKKKRDPDDEGGRGRKKKKGSEEDEWDSESDNDDDDDDDDAPSTPVQTRAKGKKSTTVTSAPAGAARGSNAGPPKWATNAKSILLDANAEGPGMGGEWTAVTDLWWELEKCNRFSSQVRVAEDTKFVMLTDLLFLTLDQDVSHYKAPQSRWRMGKACAERHPRASRRRGRHGHGVVGLVDCN
jgi:hypothetical protein